MVRLSAFLFLLSFLPYPLHAAPEESRFTRAKAVTPSFYNKLQLIEQYAAAAYCNRYPAQLFRKLSCSSANCPRVQQANTNVVLSFQETPNTDTAGYVALDHTNGLIIMGFRGVETWTNIKGLLNISPSDNELCNGCQVVAGLYNFWRDVRGPVLSAVRAAQAQYPNYRVTATGHSLGGAIATFAAAELRSRARTFVDLVTFGAPRVGNDMYVAYLMAQAPIFGQNIRIVHKGDPIPSIPWASMGYRHPGPEYVINSDTATPVTPEDIEIKRNDDEDGDVTPGILDNSYDDSWRAHTWYFNAITICYDGGSFADATTPFKNDPEAIEASSRPFPEPGSPYQPSVGPLENPAFPRPNPYEQYRSQPPPPPPVSYNPNPFQSPAQQNPYGVPRPYQPPAQQNPYAVPQPYQPPRSYQPPVQQNPYPAPRPYQSPAQQIPYMPPAPYQPVAQQNPYVVPRPYGLAPASGASSVDSENDTSEEERKRITVSRSVKHGGEEKEDEGDDDKEEDEDEEEEIEEIATALESEPQIPGSETAEELAVGMAPEDVPAPAPGNALELSPMLGPGGPPMGSQPVSNAPKGSSAAGNAPETAPAPAPGIALEGALMPPSASAGPPASPPASPPAGSLTLGIAPASAPPSGNAPGGDSTLGNATSTTIVA